MLPIQIILISASVFIAFYIYFRLRSNLLDAILIFLFLGGGIFLIISPDITTSIAKWLGVNRGINLVLYFTVFFFLFLILKLYSRIRRLEQKFTDFVRYEAMASIEYFGKEEASTQPSTTNKM
jgi:small membrane protein